MWFEPKSGQTSHNTEQKLLKNKITAEQKLEVVKYAKQGLVQDYTQRLIEGNIYRQKLSRLKLSRLRPMC